jgi:hypothetical protein
VVPPDKISDGIILKEIAREYFQTNDLTKNWIVKPIGPDFLKASKNLRF